MTEPGVATTADIAMLVEHLKRMTQTFGTLQTAVTTLSQSVDRLARGDVKTREVVAAMAADVKTI